MIRGVWGFRVCLLGYDDTNLYEYFENRVWDESERVKYGDY